MSDGPSPHISNERLKGASNMFFNVGAALFAAAVVKTYSDRALSLESIGWLCIASTLIWIGWLVLGLLETEK